MFTNNNEKHYNRRTFLKGALATTAVAAGFTTLGSCVDTTTPNATAKRAEYLPESWDFETDILVVGCGGAGISAGITAKKENLGDVLLIEAAPEGFEGGNTRVSAQVIFIPKDVEGAMRYQRNLNGGHVVDDLLLQSWAENICENLEWFESLDIDVTETTFYSPEWPEIEGSETSRAYLAGDGMGNEHLWNALAEVAAEVDLPIEYDTRATELIYEPETREVLGVFAETPDGKKSFKARKGVLLACGGFEANPEMISNFYQIGYYETTPMGCPYNKGDGIAMAQSVGAALWHMNNFANNGYGISAAGLDAPVTASPSFAGKDYIYVGPDGKRYIYEETVSLARHGKYLYNGDSTNLRTPIKSWAVFGSACFEKACIAYKSLAGWISIHNLLLGETNKDYLDAGVIVSGATPAELATKIGVDPAALEHTIAEYNANAAGGGDPILGRGTDVYSAFNYGAMGEAGLAGESGVDTSDAKSKPAIEAFPLEQLVAPYYAVEIHIQTLNTQGGPKRGASGEVLDTKNEGIPRLYAAGEMGTVYAFNYNGGGNVSEALSSGRLAARSIAALDPWE